MSTPKFGAVIDALVELASTTSAGEVYDGPQATAEYPESFVVIGGTEDPDDEPSSFNQDWNGLGARTKVEEGEVNCAILVGTGNTASGAKPSRDRALAILTEIEDKVRLDPTLGGTLAGGWAQVSAGRFVQRINSQGIYVRVVFTVSYQTKN